MKQKTLAFSLIFFFIASIMFIPVKVGATAVFNTTLINFTPKHTAIDSSKSVMYALDADSKKVYSINYLTKEVAVIQLDLTPERLYFANGKLYVAMLKSGHQNWTDSPEEGSIAVIDASSFIIKNQFSVNVCPFPGKIDTPNSLYLVFS